MPSVAMCPSCEVPLVSTFAWDKHEFYCLDCGGHFGFLQPVRADETTALLTDTYKRTNEFLELGAKDLIPQHQQARKTEAELAAHRATIERLQERRTTEVSV